MSSSSWYFSSRVKIASRAASADEIVGLDRERLLEELDGLRAVAEAVLVAARDLRRELVGELRIEVLASRARPRTA